MKLYALIFLFLAFLLRVLADPTPAPNCKDDISKLINATIFDQMFKYRTDPQCQSQGFYTYDAFLVAARSFSRFGFGTTGGVTTRKRELIAFLAQTSHQTTGGWPTAPDSPYAWGYCRIKETTQDSYCKSDPKWPCVPNQKYYGRGPMQLTYNYNYGQAGKALGLNLLKNPDLVATDAIVSFKTAIWFWMTPQGIKPSSHEVIIRKWRPSNADKVAGRVPGYGVITNIIDGGYECGHGADVGVADRIGFYERYCKMLGINPGKNLDCYFQKPFVYPDVTK